MLILWIRMDTPVDYKWSAHSKSATLGFSHCKKTIFDIYRVGESVG